MNNYNDNSKVQADFNNKNRTYVGKHAKNHTGMDSGFSAANSNFNNVPDEVFEPELYDSPEDFTKSVSNDLETKRNSVKEGYVANSKQVWNNKTFSDYNAEILTYKKSRKKIIIIVAAIVFFILLLISGISAWALMNTSFESPEESFQTHEELSTVSIDEPFYMVLVGTDTREEDGQYSLTDGRSDTCILAHIDPKNYIVTMISIPRDTLIVLNGSYEKFNAAYSYGGITETIKQVKKLCNVEVSHYAEISFNGLTDMVNAVGGVEIDVPDEINDDKSGEYVPKGLQTLNGDQALSFSRSRNFGDGDFTRTADQRLLIQALINKAFNMSLTDLPNVIKAAKNFLKTDFTVGEMLGLAKQFKEAGQLTMYSAMVPSSTTMIGGVSYCITDKDALRRMILMVENGEDPSLVEITSGASAVSSRDAEELAQRQKEYYAAHPDSPGKASNSKKDSSSNLYDDLYYDYNESPYQYDSSSNQYDYQYNYNYNYDNQYDYNYDYSYSDQYSYDSY